MKTRKGGQKVKVDVEEIVQFEKTICEHKKDCAASCFYVLGYTNLENSIYLASRTTTGLHLTHVRDMLDAAYGKGHDWGYEWLEKVGLEKNVATIAFVHYEDKGHFFILCRIDDDMYAIDPQLKKMGLFEDYIQIFKDIHRILFLNSHTTVDVNSELVTKEIIDSVLDPPLPDMPDDVDIDIDELLKELEKEEDSKPKRPKH